METAKMSKRGQIIIPKEVRDEVHASTNTTFVVEAIDKDTIVMKKLDSAAWIKEFREMRKRTAKLTPKQVEDLIHEVRKEKRSSKELDANYEHHKKKHGKRKMNDKELKDLLKL